MTWPRHFRMRVNTELKLLEEMPDRALKFAYRQNFKSSTSGLTESHMRLLIAMRRAIKHCREVNDEIPVDAAAMVALHKER